MQALTINDVADVSGGVSAAGVCRAYVANMGGVVALGAGVGATGGVGFIAGAGLYSFGFSMGAAAAEFICPN